MSTKRIGFRIGTACSALVAIIAYFLPIFKIRGGDLFNAASKIFGGDGVKTKLSPFDLIVDLLNKNNLNEETKQLLQDFRINLDDFGIFIILLMIIPLVIAIANLGLSFIPNEKVCGATLAGTNALTFILTIVSVIIFSGNVKGIVFKTTKLGISPIIAGVGYLAALIVAICYIFAAKKDVDNMAFADGYAEDPMYFDPNGYVDPNGYTDPNGYMDPNGYVDPNGYMDPGYFPPDGGFAQGPEPVEPDVTVILDDQSKGFINTPAEVAGSLNCIQGPYKGTSFPVKAGEEIVIGRDPLQCHLIIDSSYKFVSKKHCAVGYIDDKFKLTVFSSNGVFLNNDKKVPQGKKIVLSRGDVISIGNKDVSFEIR